ncbi:MAG: HEAT repeat domain-containing protein, partial [Longimicrobiales bacterium]
AAGAELDRAADLWLGLARSSIGMEEGGGPGGAPDADEVASAISGHHRDTAYDQVIVGYLLQLAGELKAGRGREAEGVRKRVSNLMKELDPTTLQRLVEMGGSDAARRRFVLDANQSLAVDAVLRIVQASADASQQTISHSLTRLLSKLSSHAESGVQKIRSQADDALRDNVEDLIRNWELKDPNPDDYTLILDSMARSAPVFDASQSGDEVLLSGAHRIVQMSVEVDAWGPTVAKAVSDLTEAGQVGFLLRMADSAPKGSRVVERLTDLLTSPAQLMRILSGEDVREDTLRAVVHRMGRAAIPILLDVLTESEARSIRRKVFEVLVEFGQEAGPFIPERLNDPRWFVLRNMLALVRRLPERPEGFSAGPFLDHEDVRVRREAVALGAGEEGLRERALALGLKEPDERLLRTVLLELQESLPETLLPVLVSRVIRSDHEEDLKAMAIKALRHSRSNLVLETLLEVCSEGRSILGRVKLAPPSPGVLAALQVLLLEWKEDPRAREVLEAARRSKDPRFREAITGRQDP